MTRWPAACAVILLAAGCRTGGSNGASHRAAVDPRRGSDPTTCAVRHGKVVAATMMSATLGPQRYRVYLPPGYVRTVKRRYPVLYLLHGSGADETQWEDVGIGQGADCLLAAHRMHPTLIVMLDAEIAEHRVNGTRDVEQFVLHEVIPTIDYRLPTLADRSHRAIGGISLGGGWSLRIAADHPDRFAAVGGHSPATSLTPNQRTSLAIRRVRVWLDVATHDGLRTRVTGLQSVLRERGGDVVLHVWPGRHDRRYWSHHVQDYLKFYAAGW